ncbi:metallopeptidase MepB [Podospora aff. communis PSN243]|uniref:Metallopeptidase MepB n=1 Tax=Podospora aff. communis PSN243 TaxID=3040156 RepID=A0AAV9H680_9PEZI|nr:metallopeptidase MepB [Podospora aff. communis PSN243]
MLPPPRFPLLSNLSQISSIHPSHRCCYCRAPTCKMDQGPAPRTPPQSPPSFDLTPAFISLRVESLIEASNKAIGDIVSAVSPNSATFGTVIGPLAHAENARLSESCILCSFRTTSLDPALREAGRNAGNAFDELELQFQRREDIFRLIDAVRCSINSKKLPEPSPEGRHFLDKIHQDFLRNGLGLPAGPPRERFISIQRRINALSNEFASNLDHQTKGVWFTFNELEGVPERAIAAMEKGTGEHEGELFLDFSTDPGWISAAAIKEETRRRLHIARNNRCNDNIPIFKEVALLRDEAARLLGYRSHAAMVVQDKMAGDTTTIYKLLEGLRAALGPVAGREVERFRELKKKDAESRGEEWDGRVYQWDASFYARKVRLENKEDAVDKSDVSEYFPLQHTVDVMLETMGGLFGLIFSKVNENSPVQHDIWHDDVQVFDVWNSGDEGGDFVGFLYLDLFTRDFKPQSPVCRSLVLGYTRPDGSRNYPSTVLFCPFKRPTDTQPSLLSHHNATQLFHELGHGIHNLVSKTTYARFHGSSGTAVDFGEAPSQLLENWLRVPSQLKRLSRHYATLSEANLRHWQQKHKTRSPAPDPHLPDTAIDHLLKLLPLGRALNYLGDVHIATWDFAIHDPASREALEGMDISSTFGQLQRGISLLSTPWHQGEGDALLNPFTGFTNMICGDYHAGYYGYLLSEMYAMDIWENVVRGDGGNKEAGRRLRRGLLDKGGSRPERETMLEFLEREADPGPYYKWLGV